MNEHLIRAITIRLAFLMLGDEAGKKALNEEMDLGFAYLPGLLNKLQGYEEARNQYPGLADFYPKLIDGFGKKP